MNKQLELFPILKGESNQSFSSDKSYRQNFGLENPPIGTVLKIKYMDGLKWYLHWENCPDDEDIIQAWFGTAAMALKYANQHGWTAIKTGQL